MNDAIGSVRFELNKLVPAGFKYEKLVCEEKTGKDTGSSDLSEERRYGLVVFNRECYSHRGDKFFQGVNPKSVPDKFVGLNKWVISSRFHDRSIEVIHSAKFKMFCYKENKGEVVTKECVKGGVPFRWGGVILPKIVYSPRASQSNSSHRSGSVQSTPVFEGHRGDTIIQANTPEFCGLIVDGTPVAPDFYVSEGSSNIFM